MRRVRKTTLACLLAIAQLTMPLPVVYAQAQSASDKVSLNFVDTDIPAVLRALSLFTQRNYLVDPRVKGKLTLVSERPVDRDTAVNMLAGALRMQGYAIVDVDGVTRVVPESDAKLQGSSVVVDPPSRAGAPAPVSMEQFARGTQRSEIITRVFSLKYENAANLLPVLRPLVPPNNPINAYPGNNTLVVTDYADNLDRIASVIARVDVPSAIDTDVVPVRYGVASDLAALATQLLDAQGNDATQRMSMVADPRTNSVLIRSGSPARTKLARDLIAKLDTAQSRPGNLHVVYLRNAQASRLAEVLGGLLNSQALNSASAMNGTGGIGGGAAISNATGSNRSTTPRSNSNSNSNRSSSGSMMGSSSGDSTLGLQQIERDTSSADAVSYSGGGATIQADPTTNTLIISAPEPLYRSLREVIDQLDQRRAQVLVESLIVEVSQETAAEFGIQWMTGSGNLADGSGFVGGTNLGGSGIGSAGTGATTLDMLGSGLSLGVVKGTVDVLGTEIINLGVLARALNATGEANILSTPNLLTLDNESASILVGKTVPFVTGQYVTSGSDGSGNPFQTIEREDVGLKLNIRPQISEGGSVKLDIYQEVSSIDETSSSETMGIVTNKRAIDTSVLVDDGQIIVLGGLLEDSVGTTTEGVPGLSSIPILGALFRYDTRRRTKSNLMVFLRPYVVRNAHDSANVTINRYDYMRRTQSAAQPGKHWLLPDMQAPILPPSNVDTVGSNERNGSYDMRPEAINATMRRPPPTTTQTFQVRQLPQPPGASDPSLPIRANLPRGVSIATDPSALYAETRSDTTILQFASAPDQATADRIVRTVRISGLNAYSQVGPGGQGYVVRADISRDATTVDTAVALLKELGYRAELVTHL
ncbi:type II secretion system secretin GspD [Bordetella tumulicola]|uniref:type II secretion system secretin GspD n=1 Tax=Bordetella tumulicola TaxID=1649133 RepID=UPI0039EDFD6F